MAKILGLKCDNPTCDYVDMSIERKDYALYVDVPCPLCGDSLLTQADYEAVKLLEKAESLLPKWMRKGKTVVKLDGTGLAGMEISEEDNG